MQTVQRNPLERAIVAVCSLVLWLTTAVIFLILTANTVLRYVSGSSLQWANELPELLFPWLVMAGVVMAAEKGAHIGVTPYPLAIDEGLRRGLDAVLFLECVGFSPRAQPAVVNLETLAPQQPARLQAVGANVAGHDHAVQPCASFGVLGHGELRRRSRHPA